MKAFLAKLLTGILAIANINGRVFPDGMKLYVTLIEARNTSMQYKENYNYQGTLFALKISNNG